jgi:anti-sigma-K factor RskA
MTMDDDHIVLAAEWVLGTLEGDEYSAVEALIANDPEFAVLVREWERKLGELNVLVAPVEPPDGLLEKILTRLPDAVQDGHLHLPDMGPRRQLVEGLAATLGIGGPVPPAGRLARPVEVASPNLAAPAQADQRARIVHLNRRVRRWQEVGAVFATLAAAIAMVFVTSLVRPDLLPRRLQPQPKIIEVVKTVEVPAKAIEPARFTAVLQRDAASPAFILTVDLADRTMTVRRVAADDPVGKSFELWLVSNRYPAPRSLGVVQPGEFTRPSQLAAFDTDTIRDAVFAISLEPEGGSPTGAATGPVLWTGKLIETLPAGPAP